MTVDYGTTTTARWISVDILLYMHVPIVTLLTVLTQLGHTTPSDNIVNYLAMDYCNNTLDAGYIEIGVLNFNLPIGSLVRNISMSSCAVTLATENDMYIGIQFLQSQQNDSCCSHVHIDRKYCQNNTTLYKEVNTKGMGGKTAVQLTFVLSQNDGTASNCEQGVNVSVLFYLFSTPSPVFAACPNGFEKCVTNRCLPYKVYTIREVYDLCQTTGIRTTKQTTPMANTQTEQNETFSEGYIQGLMIFGAVMALFLLGLFVIYFCTKSNHVNGPVLVTDGTSRHRPVFTLNEDAGPPPNYSELSLNNNGINMNAEPTSYSGSNAETMLSSPALDRVCVQFRVSTDASLGRVSNSLPPTYSDAVMNEQIYHIHT